MILALLFALAADPAVERLEKSPRHHEWVKVDRAGRPVNAFVVYPQVKDKAAAVIVIHENKGLTDWVRSAADEVAEAGYIAVAPDLLGDTKKFASPDDATKAIRNLTPEQVLADLDAVADYAKRLPAANGKLAVVGFCWGGGQSFRFAAHRPDLSAAFVFYGAGPQEKDAASRVKTKVYGFYGGNDARINATVPKTAEAMKEAGKSFEPVTYEGAGHGFMRAGEAPDAKQADKKAREEAWARWRKLLAR